MWLSEKEKLRIMTRHRTSIEQKGYQPTALFWSSQAVQEIRFQQFVNYIKPKLDKDESASLLDVGCGFGDLKNYLAQQNCSVRYTGIDVSPDMVFAGSCQYKGIDLREGELPDFKFKTNTFDYVVLSGALNEVVDSHGDYARYIIVEMLRVAKKGLVFNLLNQEEAWTEQRSDLQSFSPDEMLLFCQTLCPSVTLNKDYLPNDFTLTLTKVPK